MPITKISTQGRAFVRLHEGNPLTCYLDPVGIPTMGTGFTMRSDSVRRELEKIGITKLVPGKTKITAAQSDAILDAVLAAEYVPEKGIYTGVASATKEAKAGLRAFVAGLPWAGLSLELQWPPLRTSHIATAM